MKYGYLKVASAVPKIEIADCHYNTSQIENFMAKAEGLGAEIIVFPELCVTGYSCQVGKSRSLSAPPDGV